MNTLVYRDNHIKPQKIVCIGRNYVEHINELGNEVADDMVVFCKPNSAISDHLYAHKDEPLHYETELCFLTDRNARLVAVAIGLDLTKRQLQNTLKQKGLPWERAKAFDDSATFSQFVPIPGNLENLSFTLHVDGELIQQGDPSLMIYSPSTILKELSQFMTLNENDVIMTGTPKGVGEVKQGSHYIGRVFYNDTQLIEHTWIGQ